MEGLVYYIKKEPLLEMFSMISNLNAAIVFDYFLEDFINKKDVEECYGAKEYIANVQTRLFEGQVTGFPEDISKFLELLHFKNILNLGSKESEALYLKNVGLKDLGFVRYVVAETQSFHSQK